MNTDAVYEAEQDLYWKVYSGEILSEVEIYFLIRKIIAAYIQIEYVDEFMKKHELTAEDLEFIYYHLFSCIEFFECFHIGENITLFPTAVLLDAEASELMNTQLEYYSENVFCDRKSMLCNVCMSGAKLFYARELVKRNIVSREFLLTYSADLQDCSALRTGKISEKNFITADFDSDIINS